MALGSCACFGVKKVMTLRQIKDCCSRIAVCSKSFHFMLDHSAGVGDGCFDFEEFGE